MAHLAAKNSRGFTIIELMLVVAILGFTAYMVVPATSSQIPARDLETSAMMTVDFLRQAQSNVMSGHGGTSWSVRFESGRLVLFPGSVYSPSAEENTLHDFSAGVRVVDVSISGGSCDLAGGTGNCTVNFIDSVGRPAQVGTITIANDAGASKIVSVNTEGMTDYN